MKTVSVVIPAKNEEKHLPRCLASLARQTYPRDKVEIIVVDNGSTDRTREIAEGFGARVLRDDASNVSGLRNRGAAISTGEVLAFVDADCEAAPDWIERGLAYWGDGHVAGWGAPPEPPEGGTWVQKTWYLVRKKEKPVQDVDWLETMNLFVRRSDFEAVGGFNESLVTCEDVDFSYRLRAQGRIVADARIRVIHHGEAATVKDFCRKELWRGRSNLAGLRSHGLRLAELPSLLLPFYVWGFLPVSLVASAFFARGPWRLLPAALFLLPSLAALTKVRTNLGSATDAGRLVVLLQAYFLCRAAAAWPRGRR